MAKINPVAIVETNYRILFIPVATYKRVGEVSLLTVFGMAVYTCVGKLKSIFGYQFSG